MYLSDYWNTVADHEITVILLEDIHWADESSLDFINHLASAIAKRPFFIVCYNPAQTYLSDAPIGVRVNHIIPGWL